MKKAVIYARVSSMGDRQSTDRQVADLTKYAEASGLEVVQIFTEKMSGAVANRPVLDECLDFCIKKKVSCLLVSEISRLGRSLKIIVDTLDRLTAAGVDVFLQNLGIHTLDDTGKKNPFGTLLISVMGACAEIERESISYRLRSGRELAKQRGVYMGRPTGTKLSNNDLLKKYPDVLRKLNAGQSLRNTAKLCDVSLSTVQRIAKAKNKK